MSRNRTILLAAAALLGVVSTSARAQPATRSKDPTTVKSLAAASGELPAPQRTGEPKPRLLGNDDDPPGPLDMTKLLWQMLAYVLVILALGGAIIFVVKRVLPKLRAVRGKSISVVETIHLGPRQSVHLLQVGRQKLLVAGTREQISMLAEVTEAFPEGTDEPAGPASGKEAATR